MASSGKDYLSIKEFTGRLPYSERRIRQFCSEGQIPGARKIGRKWLIPVNALGGFGKAFLDVQGKRLTSYLPNLNSVGVASSLDFECEPYIYVPLEADIALKAFFETLRGRGNTGFHIYAHKEDELCAEFEGKVIYFPLPFDEAIQFINLMRFVDSLGRCLKEIVARPEFPEMVRAAIHNGIERFRLSCEQ